MVVVHYYDFSKKSEVIKRLLPVLYTYTFSTIPPGTLVLNPYLAVPLWSLAFYYDFP